MTEHDTPARFARNGQPTFHFKQIEVTLDDSDVLGKRIRMYSGPA